MKQRNWIEIRKSDLLHNLNLIKQTIPKKTIVACCVKSNAYGLGVENIAKVLSNQDVWFCVQSVNEAINLREIGINNRIIIISAIYSFEIEDIIKYNLTPVISSYNVLEGFAAELNKKGLNNFPIHLFFESGMNWLGMQENTIIKSIEFALKNDIFIEGVATHFASSDDGDTANFNSQLNRFLTIKQKLLEINPKIKYFHCANSGAVINHKNAHLDIVQPGIILYGLYPSNYTKENAIKNSLDFKFIASLKTRLINIKTIQNAEGVGYGPSFIASQSTTIAILPIGYNNGFSRLSSNKLTFKYKGINIKQIGNIGMNSTMIDITNVKEEISEEDEIVIFENENDIEEIAKTRLTINYEVITNLKDVDWQII